MSAVVMADAMGMEPNDHPLLEPIDRSILIFMADSADDSGALRRVDLGALARRAWINESECIRRVARMVDAGYLHEFTKGNEGWGTGLVIKVAGDARGKVGSCH